MTEVTVTHAGPVPVEAPRVETPSQRIVARANEIVRVTDARGRQIGIRKLGVLDRARFFEMIGSDNAKNEAFLSIAVPAQMVVEIDGRDVRRPFSRRELDARMQELDDDGLDAVNQGIVEHFAPEEGASKEQLGNEPGTPS